MTTRIDSIAKSSANVSGDENELGVLYEEQGKFDETEVLYTRALAGQKRQIGADHSDTLLAIYDLACLYQSQRKYGGSKKLYEQELAGEVPIWS